MDKGNVEWGVPEYNGGLFSEKQEISLIGASLSALTLRNDEFGPILRDLLLDETEEGLGPVGFRSIQEYHLPAPDRIYYRLTEEGKDAGEELWSNPLFTLYPEIGPSHMKKPI